MPITALSIFWKETIKLPESHSKHLGSGRTALVIEAAGSDAQGAELADWLKDRGIAVLPIRRMDTRFKGAPLRIYGVVDDAAYRENWPLLPGLFSMRSGR